MRVILYTLLQYLPIIFSAVALSFNLFPNYLKPYLKYRKLLGIFLILSAAMYSPNVLLALLMFNPSDLTVLASLGGPIAIFLAGVLLIVNKTKGIAVLLLVGIAACVYLNWQNIPPNLLFKLP